MPRSRSLVVAALLPLLLATGCSQDDEPPASPSPSTSPAPAPLPLPVRTTTDVDPIRTSTRPVWTSDDLPAAERSPQVVGDLMLLTGERRLVVDLRSGQVVWRAPLDDVVVGSTTGSLSDVDDASALVETAAGSVVVQPYFSFACAFGCPEASLRDGQAGTVALDARTGEVVWGTGLTQSTQADFLRPRDDLERLSVAVEGVSISSVVVVGVADYGVLFYDRPDRTLPAYAVGLDPATGKRLWARRDVVVDAVAGDLVVGRVNDEEASSLVGLDARTGEELWRSTETTRPSSVSPRVVVLDDVDGGVRLLDARTGKPRPTQPPAGTIGCADWVSGDLDVACAWSAPDDPGSAERLLTSDADGALSLSAPLSDDDRADWSPVTLHDGVVVVDSHAEVPGAVDAAGRALLTRDPGLAVVSLTDRYVVLVGDSTYGGYEDLEVLGRR